jgi:antitoxin component of RelBE/YafQ-DinJ toxin-antitoxin module
MARDVRVAVRLSAEVHEQVVAMAKARGVTMSALIAWVVGEWIIKQKSLEPLLEKMGVDLVDFVKQNAGRS